MKYRDFNDIKIPTFGLHGVFNGVCECLNPECKALYKHPKTASWQHSPVWDEEQLDVLELTDAFTTGYGVLCNNLIVIDVDARNGGVDSYEKLVHDCHSILECEYIVSTGSGGGSKHLYFKLPIGHPKLNSHIKQYPGIDFKSSGFVVGEGSMHQSGNRYTAMIGTPNDITEAPSSLINLLKASTKPVIHHSDNMEIDNEQLIDIVSHIPNANLEYDDWIMVGMAIHETTSGTGYDIWHDWSAQSSKHDDSQMIMKWKSFGKNPSRYTVGTLLYIAKENGYVFTHNITMPTDIPNDIDWSKRKPEIDLLDPPGIVGRITRWMNGQNMFPRERLSVAASIMAVSCAIGLRYRGAYDTTANLFMFCVAGSSTGKESVIKSFNALLQKAELSEAISGGIISEQEIIRNAIQHQANFYNIDEFGEVLGKIQNARKKGSGSSHLEGIVGMLMSIYSKSNATMLISQTHKKTFKADMIKEISFYKQKERDNEILPNEKLRMESLQNTLKQIDTGIHNPFVNILGFTAPNRFNGLLDMDLADSGFFARALIVRE